MGQRYTKMSINKLQNVNTRQQMRTGEVTEANKITKPLCKQFPGEGSVDFYSHSDMDIYEGIFSFVLYYNNNLDNFKQTKYYLGLLIYAEIIHQNPFFSDYGMIVYTDEQSYAVLSSVLSVYPKLIVAVTHWPKFAINSTITGTVLRCLRFHALEAFPKSHILVRDADTIFVGEIASFDHIYAMGYKTTDVKTGKRIEDYRQFLIDVIGAWEKQFIELWIQENSPILFGIAPDYIKSWHTEFPFIYPIKNIYANNMTKNRKNGRILIKYENKSGTRFSKRAPSGIFAGFANFLKSRPDDLWMYSYDYIERHYKLIESEDKKREISDKRLWINSVGKDERILIFTMILKYTSKCYFLLIEYTSSVIIEQIYYLKNARPFNQGYSYTPLANIEGESQHITGPNYNKYGKHQIRSFMLHPNYLTDVFNKKIDEEFINKIQFGITYFNNVNGNTDMTINDLYKSHFKKFANEYVSWLTLIMSIPEEDIKKTIHNIILNAGLSEETNFYEPPSRIKSSRLPPIVPENNKTRRNNRANNNLLWFQPVKNNRLQTRRNNRKIPSLLD